MLRIVVCLAVVVFAFSGGAGAAYEAGTKEEAIALVHRVQASFETKGLEATFAAITRKEFNEQDRYPFVFDLNGVNVGTGGNVVLVGKNLISLRDQDGKYLIQEMISIARGPGSGWISYKWPHPATGKIQDKTSYIESMGDYVIGVGIWDTKR